MEGLVNGRTPPKLLTAPYITFRPMEGLANGRTPPKLLTAPYITFTPIAPSLLIDKKE